MDKPVFEYTQACAYVRELYLDGYLSAVNLANAMRQLTAIKTSVHHIARKESMYWQEVHLIVNQQIEKQKTFPELAAGDVVTLYPPED
jgi:hypothetical protein